MFSRVGISTQIRIDTYCQLLFPNEYNRFFLFFVVFIFSPFDANFNIQLCFSSYIVREISHKF